MMLTSPFLLPFNTVLEVLATVIRQKRNTSYPNWKVRSKTNSFCKLAHDLMYIYIYIYITPKHHLKKLLELKMNYLSYRMLQGLPQ